MDKEKYMLVLRSETPQRDSGLREAMVVHKAFSNACEHGIAVAEGYTSAGERQNGGLV